MNTFKTDVGFLIHASPSDLSDKPPQMDSISFAASHVALSSSTATGDIDYSTGRNFV